MARILPRAEPTRGCELADALRERLAEFHVGEKEATSWLHDLEQARGVADTGGPWNI